MTSHDDVTTPAADIQVPSQPDVTAVDSRGPLALPGEALAERLPGKVRLPGDADWDEARRAWNLAIDQRPIAVVLAETAADVAATIRAAAELGLRVAPQGTGHNAAALGAHLAGTVLLKTAAMREVVVDVEARTVRAQAGCIWADVTSALAPHGLMALAGSSHDVGVVGYAVGGGYSWYAREHGLTTNHVTAFEVVTGDGRELRVDASHQPELFWALRGGGGGAGAVVTAVEMRVFERTEVFAGQLFFPLERAREVFVAYRNWARTAPDTATTAVRLLRLPPMEELPEFLRGQSFAVVGGAIDLPAEQAAEVLAPLRALGPAIDTFATMPVEQLSTVHMDPPGPVPGCGDGFVLHELADDTIDWLMAVAGPTVQTPLLAIDLRQLGGAASRPAADGGAVSALPGEFLVYVVGIAPTPEAKRAVESAVRAVRASLATWMSDRDYLNFRENDVAAERFWDADTLRRLREVAKAYDPSAVITSNHPLR